ncbi:hypothetical protein BH24ACT15_BH24ACT15_32210 [soil metagenome]
MLTIEITDFQSITQATVVAEGLTVVVGPSNRGKSALLRAVEAALFNRVGDQFVRSGATVATVALELSDRDPAMVPHTVIWAKGDGRNQFRVDGEDYAKVGTKAPDILRTLGFRDVVIGARQRDGKSEGGEVLRPQVARQFGFDPVFLFDRPGAFVNELMVRVSRLGVLQRAGRQCSLDLKTQKQLLKVRQQDLVVAEAERARLAGVEAVRQRVLVLKQRQTQHVEAQQRALRLRGLLLSRQQLLGWLARPLPEVRRLSPMAVQVAALAALVGTRQVLQTQQATLPAARKIKAAVTKALQQWQQLRPLVTERHQQTHWMQQYEAEAERHSDLVTTWQSERAQLKLQLQVCPTCERPF